jgi:16S rRNA (guanine1207-N2)-methyltransferase
MNEDVYFKKIIDLKYGGKPLQFRVSQDLFSSFQVDTGTRFLLRTLEKTGTHSFDKILDLGCGYGPLGLALKSDNTAAVVHMVDRDALAVEYSRRNAELNGFGDIQVYGSLGYDDVREKDFDIIVANIPGKAGEPVITHFLKDARYFLRPGGLVAVVVVNAIAPMVEGILNKSNDIDIVLRQSRSGHTVFHYRFAGGPAGNDGDYISGVERNVYHRNETSFRYHDFTWRIRTAYGLPEFDTLHYRTVLLLEGLNELEGKSLRSSAVFNAGQGHVPVFIRHVLRPDSITLADRDLLSLRYAQSNLVLNGCSKEQVRMLHRAGFPAEKGKKVGLIAGVLREEEGPLAVFNTVKAAVECLDPEGILLVSGSSTAISRLMEKIKTEKIAEVVERKKRRGYRLVVVKHGQRDGSIIGNQPK